MNVYVFSDNNYLYSGIEKSLKEIGGYDVFRLNTNDINLNSKLLSLEPSDTLLLVSDGKPFEFTFLDLVNKSTSRVIYSVKNENYRYHGFFDFMVLNEKFTIQNFLFLLKSKIQRFVFRPPNFTDREKIVLGFILKGVTVRCIARSMNLSVKTIHGYKINLFKKLGIRKYHNLAHLPIDFVDYIYKSKNTAT